MKHAPPNERATPAPMRGGSLENGHNGSATKQSDTPKSWRDQYAVHPAADVFPMMSDDELAKLGEDIKANGLHYPIVFHVVDGDEVLVDGRNRLEAAWRAGIPDEEIPKYQATEPNVVGLIISSNIHRRHLTKQQQADLIVAAIKADDKPPQLEAVYRSSDEITEVEGSEAQKRALKKYREKLSKGGRGKVNPVKQKAIATAQEHGISKATVERALAKSEGKKPKPRETQQNTAMPIDAARRVYLLSCEFVSDLDAERGIINEALREIAGKRIMARQAASVPAAIKSDAGEIPAFLDRSKTR